MIARAGVEARGEGPNRQTNRRWSVAWTGAPSAGRGAEAVFVRIGMIQRSSNAHLTLYKDMLRVEQSRPERGNAG